MDLGNKTFKDLKTQMTKEMTTPQEDTTTQAIDVAHEGLQNDKEKMQRPTIIPTNLLPKHKKTHHHKPDIIRAIGYKWNIIG